MIHLMHHPKTIRLGLFRCESFIRCQSTRHIALECMRAYCTHLRFLDFAGGGTISQSDFYLACAPMAHGCPSSLQYVVHLQYPRRVHLILLLLSHVKSTGSTCFLQVALAAIPALHPITGRIWATLVFFAAVLAASLPFSNSQMAYRTDLSVIFDFIASSGLCSLK